MLELWRENCKLIWKLQTHMKIANSYENCKRPCRNYTPKCELQTDMKIANWYENCKLIWKLQTDMRIAKQFSCFGVLFLCGCLQFSYETQREWKLVLKQKECYRLIAVWMTKTQQNNLLQNLPQFIYILIPIPMRTQSDSYFKPWFLCSLGIQREGTTDRWLFLISIPTFKMYIFLYSRWMDKWTERWRN